MFMESLKLNWIQRILLNTNKYFTVIKELYPGITESIEFGNNYLEDRQFRSIMGDIMIWSISTMWQFLELFLMFLPMTSHK